MNAVDRDTVRRIRSLQRQVETLTHDRASLRIRLTYEQREKKKAQKARAETARALRSEKAKTARLERQVERLQTPVEFPHATTTGYRGGCRCSECREAHRAAMFARRRRKVAA